MVTVSPFPAGKGAVSAPPGQGEARLAFIFPIVSEEVNPMKKTLLVSLFLALALMLALPLAAQAEDYVARDSLCMAVQSGQHNWR